MIYHPAKSRGAADHGWLKSHHSFSFADYYNPERVHFGALRVLNDDWIAPERGFGTHPHRDMEIVTIPLSGALRHKDSMGYSEVLKKGEVQAMSAGTGISHSEVNEEKVPLELLQIWVIPNKMGITPRYQQKFFSPEERKNKWQVVVSNEDQGALLIQQDAFFSLAHLSSPLSYKRRNEKHLVYLFLIDGKVEVNGQILEKRDALGLESDAEINPLQESEILAIEVPQMV